MRIYGTRTREYVDEIDTVCDRCGAKQSDCEGNDWSNGSWGVNDTTISHEVGTSFPEGRFTDKVQVDLCPTCFMDWLIPLMMEHGVTVWKCGDTDVSNLTWVPYQGERLRDDAD